MSRERREKAAIKELAAQRVEAVWDVLCILRPEMPFRKGRCLRRNVGLLVDAVSKPLTSLDIDTSNTSQDAERCRRAREG